MKTIRLLLLLQGLIFLVQAQNHTVSGTISELREGKTVGLLGANIFTEDKKFGTQSNSKGYFEISLPLEYKLLIVSFVGYETQEFHLHGEVSDLSIVMKANVLDAIEVSRKKLDRSVIEPYNTQIISSEDLTKAACCNLSESFETNATVDVSFSDAVTGAKKLRMLGLDSYYTQTMYENQAGIRGLGNSFGMLYVPGPFMSSISINKGAGSVVNGYEAITGQINYAFKNPFDSERFYLNLFGTRHGQFELNTNASHRFNNKLSTILLVHGAIHEAKHDNNQDSFQDVPLNERIVVSNKWHYDSHKNFESQFGFNYLYDERSAGQLPNLSLNENNSNLFQTMNINRKYDAFAKTGFILKSKTQSIGIQYRYMNHQHQAWYGNRYYRGLENFANFNFIFQTAMPKEFNSMKLGLSYQLDYFNEQIDALDISRQERIPGVFAEYSYQDNDKMSIVAGIRGDFHNMYGFWLSPKANFKYNFPKSYTLKLAAGRGFRTNNLIAENIGALASSRTINVAPSIGFESAWNIGGSLMKEFYLGFQPGSIVIDFYRTDFTNRVVNDYEDPRALNFYMLDGKSYANSFQVETRIEATEGLDLQLAYKFDDVHVNYKSGLKLAPYIPRHKLLLTADYETKNKKWRFNLTGQLNGKSRLPSTASNPEEYQRPEYSNIFFNLNSQITTVVKNFDFYLGAENMTNYWQKNPIIGANDAYGKYFDASMIWGPLGGTRLYAGIRWTVPYRIKE